MQYYCYELAIYLGHLECECTGWQLERSFWYELTKRNLFGNYHVKTTVLFSYAKLTFTPKRYDVYLKQTRV